MARDPSREGQAIDLLGNLQIDVSHTFRQFRRSPVFTLIAVLTLALGIGGTTAIFSVVNTLLFRPLPFSEPENLVWIANTGTSGSLSSVTLRTSNLRDWRRLNTSFEAMTGWFEFYDYLSYIMTGEGEPEHVVGVGVVPDFVETLGIPLELGRNFSTEESLDNGPPAIILTHDFWRRRFGADPGLVGRSITINNTPTTVIGVLPAGFDFGTVFTPGTPIDFLNPFPVSDATDGWGNTISVIGRLKPGVSIAAAQAELDQINARLQEADPDRWGLDAAVSDLRTRITGRFERALLVLSCAIGVVLLIACTNLSNMLLARAMARRREIAVRSALGAGRARLVRQLLTESLILSVGGAVVGIGVAYLITRAVSATNAVSIPLLEAVSVDTTALLFTVIVTLVTGLLFGIIPAFRISRTREHEALKDTGRGSSQSRGRVRLREVLVSAEIALAALLLVGAGLLLRSFVTLLEVDLGFDPAGAVTWRIETNRPFDSSAERLAYNEDLIRRITALPGVETAGLTDCLPLGRNRAWGIAALGEDDEQLQQTVALPRIIDHRYLSTMRIPLVSGRDFTMHDTRESERVIIVNETLARRLWPGEDPLDKMLLVGRAYRVIGVVADVRHSSLEESAGLEMYLSIAQQSAISAVDLVVRSRLAPEALIPAVRTVLHDFDATLPTGEYRTLDEIVDLAVSPRRFILLLIGAFSGVALLLAALGVYGVISYSVTQQVPEIGIRMALGATAGRVQRGVLGRTLLLAGAGIVVGLAASLILTRLIEALLYGISPTDPLTLAGMVVVLVLIAVAAGFIPARRASRIDPVSVLGSA